MATAQKHKSPEPPEAAATCANGCGFFGTAANKGMCSKCYRETVLVATTAAAAAVPEKTIKQQADRDASLSAFSAAAPAASSSSSSSFAPPPQKKIKLTSDAATAAADPSPPTEVTSQQLAAPAKPATANRCLSCRKKVGLTGFQCRCDGTFCGAHRYAGAHSCGFDYKAAGREQIAKQNPVVIAAKMANKI